MTIESLGAYAVVFCLVVGATFSLIGSIGLLRFSDSMARMHAPTKVGTLGIGALLVAAAIHAHHIGDGSWHEVLIMAFLFVTAPISANFIAKVIIHRRYCDTPPPPPTDDTWATLDLPDDGTANADARDSTTRPAE